MNKEKLFNLTLPTLWHLQIIISTKLGQNVCDRKILKEFNYESNRDRMIRVFCPIFEKTVTFDFVYTLSSANIDQSAPNFGKIYMTIRSWMSSIMGVIAKMSLIMGPVIPDQSLLSALEIEKLNSSSLFGIYLHC